MGKVFGIASLLALLFPSVATADSDGYYCVGRGYLAFETRFSSDPAEHLLHIVEFSRARGIVRLPPIPLEDFQVHAMHCRDRVIELQAWTALYAVDVTDPDQPTVTRDLRAFEPTGSEAAANLGHWSQPGIVDLASDGVPGEFQLVIARVSRNIGRGSEHFTSSELIHRDPVPEVVRVLDSVTLFFGVFLETID